MIQVSPQIFFEKYLRELKKDGTWTGYESHPAWTPVAIGAAKWIIEKDFHLIYLNEYFRLDAMGYERRSEKNDWDLRVAFEHENSDLWDDELCKLAHVVADLRVLVSYYDFNRKTSLEACLQEKIERMEERMTRVPGSEWLFIFGPRCRAAANHPNFVGFTLAQGKLVKLNDSQSSLDVMAWDDYPRN